MDTKALSGGSARQLAIPEDTNSAVVKELVSQLNQQEIPVSAKFSFTVNGTLRIPLGTWRHNAWIKDIRIVNAVGSDIVNAGTDIFIRACTADDCGLLSGPSAPIDLLALEGFAVGNFPADQAFWGDEFEAGVNCDAVSGVARGNVVEGGNVLYAEVINAEGGPMEVIVMATITSTDYIQLFSGHLSAGDHVNYLDQNDFLPHRNHHVAAPYKAPMGVDAVEDHDGLYLHSSARKH